MSTSVITFGLFGLLFSTVSAAPRNLPPKISGSVQYLGGTKDPNFVTGNASIPNDPGFYSDGGAGGFVNGYNLVTLSDARVRTRGGLVHTVYAYAGVGNNDPTQIQIIGDYKANPHFYLQGPNGAGQGVIASDPSDACQGAEFGPGPNTMMVSLGNGTGGINAWTIFCSNGPQYNTLIEYNVVDPQTLINNNKNIPAQRTVLRLFNASQPLYGTDGFGADTTYLYLVALNNNGFKMARVAKASRTDIKSYQYWRPDLGGWKAQIPATGNTAANFLNGTNPGAGVQFGSDLFYSDYFQTWLFSYSNKDAYSASYYNLAYSTSGNVQGPYKDLGTFYKPVGDPGCDPNVNPASKGSVPGVYLTHSHPGFDTSGKTLVIGWISCNTFTNFAKITFV